MLRAKNVHFLEEAFKEDAEYAYDYWEQYWVVDDELFDKNLDSKCTITRFGYKERREFAKKDCKEWNFYLCEKFSKKTMPAPGFTFPTPVKSEDLE